MRILVAALDDGEPSVGQFAAYALGELSERAAAASPALEESLESADLDVRIHAARSLGKLGVEAAIPSLIAAFEAAEGRLSDRRAYRNEGLDHRVAGKARRPRGRPY